MTKPGAPRPEELPVAQVAIEKLTRVVGAVQAKKLFAETMAATGLTALGSADDLYLFGDLLSRRGGFEAAVGRLLTVAAVLRGARGAPSP